MSSMTHKGAAAEDGGDNEEDDDDEEMGLGVSTVDLAALRAVLVKHRVSESVTGKIFWKKKKTCIILCVAEVFVYYCGKFLRVSLRALY